MHIYEVICEESNKVLNILPVDLVMDQNANNKFIIKATSLKNR